MASLTIQERDGRSIRMRLLQIAIKPFRPMLVSPRKTPPTADRLTVPKKIKRHYCVTERKADGIWVYNLTQNSQNPARDPSPEHCHRRILYFAGGSWQMPPSKAHWAFCAELVRRMEGTKVTIISCPLAPEHPVSTAFPHIERVYKQLMTESTKAGEKVVVAGDSSGGNLALSLVAWTLKTQENESYNAPVAVLAICPTTDLRHDHPKIQQVEKLDPLHTLESVRSTAKAWCPGLRKLSSDEKGTTDWTFDDPRVSPIQADLRLFGRHNVSVHGVIGSRDILAPEAVVFRDKCEKHGLSGEWLCWNGQMHCFPLTFRYGLREGRQGMDWIISVLRKH
ncbi:Putative alpha/beta hydrolase-3, lipase, GDXG serine active [Colletotrichum destructivum]|uniref:Alpha/beta hydrolase-3, lipase, GDXG serine active n=1 Tax=Colletotrichum destructivum TaxID=34406 RepID=A0AAX4I7M1_9PEZI|nr:Putative alpha/beta hydrolase-3, lipase, GDXG serine active [Colletotrichum destructivum]